MEYYNLVIPVCMLMKAAAYCNVLVSDVVNPKFFFLFVALLFLC